MSDLRSDLVAARSLHATLQWCVPRPRVCPVVSFYYSRYTTSCPAAFSTIGCHRAHYIVVELEVTLSRRNVDENTSRVSQSTIPSFCSPVSYSFYSDRTPTLPPSSSSTRLHSRGLRDTSLTATRPCTMSRWTMPCGVTNAAPHDIRRTAAMVVEGQVAVGAASKSD